MRLARTLPIQGKKLFGKKEIAPANSTRSSADLRKEIFRENAPYELSLARSSAGSREGAFLEKGK